MILLLDNYDSFTYNLYQLIEEMGFSCGVLRNDELSLDKIKELNPTHLVVSPGPGRPDDAGVTLDAIKYFSGRIPVLGICLGHQAIAQAFGGNVVLAPKAYHGKLSRIIHDEKGLFKNLKQNINVARYHSLIVENLPASMQVSCQTDDGLIMGIRHREFDVEGLQFHPESYATEDGRMMLKNFFIKAA